MPIELVLGLSPQNLPMLRLSTACWPLLTRLMPGLLGYQIVLVAREA